MEKIERKKLLGVDAFLCLIITIIGYILLKNPQLEVLKPLAYSSAIFYMIAFFALIAYFVDRRKDDYEQLLFALNNIIVGTYLIISSTKPNSGQVLGDAVLFYSIFNFINKGYYATKLSKENNVDTFPKTAICIILLLLGILVINNLYNEITMQTLILGYYFLAFGVLSIVEPLVMYILRFPKIHNYFQNLMEEEQNQLKKESKETKTEIKKVEVKKPTANVKKEEDQKETPKKTVKKVVKKETTVKKPIAKKTTVKKTTKKENKDVEK